MELAVMIISIVCNSVKTINDSLDIYEHLKPKHQIEQIKENKENRNEFKESKKKTC